jgi:hypothetical protein
VKEEKYKRPLIDFAVVSHSDKGGILNSFYRKIDFSRMIKINRINKAVKQNTLVLIAVEILMPNPS